MHRVTGGDPLLFETRENVLGAYQQLRDSHPVFPEVPEVSMVCQLYHLAADVGDIKHGLLNRPKQVPATEHHGFYEIIQSWPYEGIPKHYRHWTNLWHCHKNNEYLAFLLCKYLLIATYILQILIFALLSVELCRFTNENNIEPIGTQHYQ